MMNNSTPKQQRWRKLWPAGFIALLATIQLLLTFAIIGLETTSLLFDFYHAMIFAGFYCSLFFMITWISMFAVTCCNRHSFGCATHALVENILSIIAAVVLLYFDSLFLNDPSICLFGSATVCNRYSLFFSDDPNSYDPTAYTVKLACIKAQLACASVMLFTNVIYIIIFIVVAIKTRNESNEVGILPYGTVPYYVSNQPVIHQIQPQIGVQPSIQVQPPIQLQPPVQLQPPIQVQPVSIYRSPNNSEYETNWRSKFPKLLVLILSIIQFVFTIIIFILEIASVAILRYGITAVGIWCAIPFIIACILTFILVYKKDASRMWASRVLVAQLVLLIFTFILIGIAGNFVETHGYSASYDFTGDISNTVGFLDSSLTKYKLIQAQLTFGILLMFSGFTYVGIYIYVTYVALWQPYHTLDTNHIFHE